MKTTQTSQSTTTTTININDVNNFVTTLWSKISKSKKTEMEAAILEYASDCFGVDYTPTSDAENEAVSEKETFTNADVEAWFAAPSKGGLKMSDIKAKAKDLGIDLAGAAKKADIKERFMNMAVDDEEAKLLKVIDTSIETGTETFTKAEVEEWFAVPSKGGLKMSEIKAKAKELGIDLAGTTKKADIKALFEASATCEEVSEDVSEDAEESAECSYVFTKGDHKGEQCTVKPKGGEHYCGKHKNCKAAQSASSSDDESEKIKAVPKKAIKSAVSGQCKYVTSRGPNKGSKCSIKPKDGEEFCAKHANTKQALGETKDAKSEDSASASKPKIKRNKELKLWYVEGDNLVVKSPKNPTVYGFLTKKGEFREKINKTVKELAEELGLEIAA